MQAIITFIMNIQQIYEYCVSILLQVFLSLNTSNAEVSGSETKQNDLIYILMWTPSNVEPFSSIELGQKAFYERNCLNQNCFITNDMNLLTDIRDYDIIIFNSINIVNGTVPPYKRARRQRYVFVSIDPPGLYPAPQYFDGFFNLTWTYKLDSNASYAFIVVRDKDGNVIGPKKEMHWVDVKDMTRIDKNVKRRLQSKNTAAAWFVSHCDTPGQRAEFGAKLIRELKKYNLKVDIFGSCGNQTCPRNRNEECYALVESDYYFYFSFENSFCEDYATEKVLTGLKHYAIPVVYGGANYTRFLPDGIYLNAAELGVVDLAWTMFDIINNKTKFYDYFKWHKYYSFHSPSESPETDEICRFCTMLNIDRIMNTTSIYDDFTKFWRY